MAPGDFFKPVVKNLYNKRVVHDSTNLYRLLISCSASDSCLKSATLLCSKAKYSKKLHYTSFPTLHVLNKLILPSHHPA